MKFFKNNYQSKKSKARVGEIHTDHGVIQTPSFVPVATKGTLKTLTPQHIADIGIQAAFVNTYHLVTHPGVDVIEKAGGIHNFSRMHIPLMSDSGGFQVFSLRNADVRGEENPIMVKISDDGVRFRSTFDGALLEFTPEKSMEYQGKIGADIVMAFDECTYYPATHEYAKKAMKRTHEWLKKCIHFKAQHRNFLSPVGPPVKPASQVAKNLMFSLSPTVNQSLYGIIQGGGYEDLRKESAEFVVSQNTDGVAIGGVSVGETKKDMREQVTWVAPYLPTDRPVHLLGIGQIDDIADLVGHGIDTFDCVEPTRIARGGRIYNSQQILSRLSFLPLSGTVGISSSRATCCEVDINKTIYTSDLSPVDEGCECLVCGKFTKAYLHHLFKQKEILGYTLATYHNLFVMEKVFSIIRKMIREDLL